MGNIIRGFGFAVKGLWYVLRYERNARIHLVAAVFALLLSLYLHVSDVELAAVFFAIIIVFLAEIVNTALEKTLDLIDTKPNHQIMIIKDMAAGAVLVAAIAAAIVGFEIFAPHIWRLWQG